MVEGGLETTEMGAQNNKNTARRVAILVCERIGWLSELPEQGQEGRAAGDTPDDDRRPPISNQK